MCRLVCFFFQILMYNTFSKLWKPGIAGPICGNGAHERGYFLRQIRKNPDHSSGIIAQTGKNVWKIDLQSLILRYKTKITDNRISICKYEQEITRLFLYGGWCELVRCDFLFTTRQTRCALKNTYRRKVDDVVPTQACFLFWILLYF